jgi:hypothetical protein
MKLPSNRERADWASIALDAFADECNMNDEDRETQLSDLLCDLMHFCDVEEINWTACVERAYDHWREEVREERGTPS